MSAMLDRPTSNRKGRRRGIAVRPEAVRDARREAGLTLAQLGGTQLTRAAVHLIENGKAKPSLESLLLIARRTGRPLAHFLVDQDPAAAALRIERALDELEQLSRERRSQEAVALAQQLLEGAPDPDTQALARLYLGQARYRLLEPELALEALRQARARFESCGDLPLAVEAMGWEAAALSLTDDPGALDLAQRALELGLELKPRPVRTLARLHAQLATLHRSRQEWTQALRSYDRALEMAGAVRDLQLLARLYDDLAEAHQHLGQPARALELMQQALRLYALESDESGVCRAENNLGDILMRQGQLDAAEPHLLRALEGSDRLGLDRRGRAYVLANLGELYWRRGDLQRAQEHLQRAREVAAALNERIVVARVDGLLGQVAEARSQPAAADRLFRQALDLLASLGVPDRLRRAHMAYGEILERREDYRSAAEHWRAAAELAETATPVLAAASGERAG
jgi:tetratricopeptide (TPR) repeat protein